jgi:hypothetical protein
MKIEIFTCASVNASTIFVRCSKDSPACPTMSGFCRNGSMSGILESNFFISFTYVIYTKKIAALTFNFLLKSFITYSAKLILNSLSFEVGSINKSNLFTRSKIGILDSPISIEALLCIEIRRIDTTAREM